MQNSTQLERTLGPLTLWGLGVGYVISGMYFGWNLGLPVGGTAGMAIATVFVTIMYLCFTLSYTELACAIPKAGGAFDYAHQGLGPLFGFVAGFAQLMEFLFAPPAIAAAIGAYFHEFFPTIPVTVIAIFAFTFFTAINIRGVKLAARFELILTIVAVIELLIFAGVSLPHFQWQNLTQNALPNGMTGAFAAVPFAIWFFLAIEGVANVAEEAVNPQKNVMIGFISAIATLVVLCALTFLAAVGVGGWEKIVYASPGANPSDSPLPLALAQIVGRGHLLYHLLLTIGLFGLVASFHGILLAAGRATFEFGRVGYFPKIFGTTHKLFHSPVFALLANMIIGIGALLTGKTDEIIILSVFGALLMYILSLFSLFALRKKQPDLIRPFKVPAYPWIPFTALVISSISLGAMILYNTKLFFVFMGIMTLAVFWFLLKRKNSHE